MLGEGEIGMTKVFGGDRFLAGGVNDFCVQAGDPLDCAVGGPRVLRSDWDVVLDR